MAGIVVSSEKISETYSGDGAKAGGVNGTGDKDVTNYAETEDGNNNGNYEKAKTVSITKLTRFIKKSQKALIKSEI